MLTLVSQSYFGYSDLIRNGRNGSHDGVCLGKLWENQSSVVCSGLRGKLVHPIMCAKYSPIETSSTGRDGRFFIVRHVSSCLISCKFYTFAYIGV